MVRPQRHRSSIALIRTSPSRPTNTNIADVHTMVKRTRFVITMTTLHTLLFGLFLLSCCSTHPHTKITKYVMAFSTHRQISPHLSTNMPYMLLLQHPTSNLLLRRNGQKTALHQETQRRRRRHQQEPAVTTLTPTNQRFKYKYFVDTLPSFLLFQPTPSVGTSTTSSTSSTSRASTHVTTSSIKKLKSLPSSSTSRIVRKKQKQFQRTIRNINSDMVQLIDTLTNTITTNVPVIISKDRICDMIYTFIIPFWYLLPSLLCLVPVYTLTVWQTIPVTPDVWKLVNMDFIWWYYTQKHHAISVIFTFLASNASFFIAALYLFKQSGTNNKTDSSTATQTATSSSSTVADPLSLSTTPASAAAAAAAALLNRSKQMPSSLGYWVLAAGVMSTIFHTVQACGNYRIAEALCYLDHGIAGTAICHFYNRCGIPSLRTIVCGIVAFIILAFPITSIHLPSYTTLHSLWHTLAAITAVIWANDATQYLYPPQRQLQQP